MRWSRSWLLLILTVTGCLRPIQTRISLDTPITGRVTAAIEGKDNISPLVEMPVQGQGCCKGPTVAIVDVDGLLLNDNMTGFLSAGENPVDLFRERLDAAASDSKVCAIVVRINSPGGAVTATDIMWHELRNFRCRTQKPVVACLMDLGCGGAYYLATAGDLIVAHPTSITGGIGVVLNLYNLQGALDVFSVTNQSIKAGKNIEMGSLLQSLTKEDEDTEAKVMLQAMAEEFYARFQAVVKQQRPNVDPVMDRKGDATTFDGRVFTAKQALDRKLIDRIGYLEDALESARALAHEPDARAVLFHRCNDVARTPYATTANTPIQSSLLPVSIPGVERSRLPTFLYLWQPDPTMQRLSGK